MASADNPDTPRLSFSSHEDALDFARQSVEDSKRFLVAHNANLIERYEQGHAAFQLKVGFNGNLGSPCEYEFLVGAVPLNWRECDVKVPCVLSVTDGCLVGPLHGDFESSERCVLVCTNYLVQCPQKIIPSLVWLELSKERDNFLRKLFTVVSDTAFKVSGAASEGEVAFVGTRDACDRRDLEGQMIQSFSQIVDGIASDFRDPFGQRTNPLDLVQHFVRILRVSLDERLVGVSWTCPHF